MTRRLVAALVVLSAFLFSAAQVEASFSGYIAATTTAAQAGTGDTANYVLTVAPDGTVQAIVAEFKTEANGGKAKNANGYDIRPYSDTTCTTPYSYQLVNYNGTSGLLEMHVSLNLSVSVGVPVYFCVGDASLTTDGSSLTWPSQYKLVVHYGSASSLLVTDSSASAQHGTATNSPTAAAGQIAGGIDHEAVGSQYVGFGTNAVSELQTFTTSFWVKVESYDNGTQSTDQVLTKTTAIASNGWEVGLRYNSSAVVAKPAIAYYDGTIRGWYEATSTIPYATKAFVVVVRDQAAGNIKFYLNGAADGTVSATTGTITYTGAALESGRGVSSNHFLDGVLDELRLSNAVTTTSWITADFNSQKASSTFLSWGSWVQLTTPSAPIINSGVF